MDYLRIAVALIILYWMRYNSLESGEQYTCLSVVPEPMDFPENRYTVPRFQGCRKDTKKQGSSGLCQRLIPV
jgi:hypothetical protein